MTDPVSLSPSVLAPTPALGEAHTREQIGKTAKQFESAFVSIMLGEMFEGVGGDEMSGGQGGQMFQSLLMDSFSKQITSHGGIGLASSVQREMLKLQGLE